MTKKSTKHDKSDEVKDVSEVAALKEDEEVTPEEDDDNKDEITVDYQDPTKGPSQRTYTKALHGKNFKKLAQQLADKYPIPNKE